MKFFLCVIGGIMIIEGLPYFAFPEKMKMWIQKVQEISSDTLKLTGFASILTGLILIYIGVR